MSYQGANSETGLCGRLFVSEFRQINVEVTKCSLPTKFMSNRVAQHFFDPCIIGLHHAIHHDAFTGY